MTEDKVKVTPPFAISVGVKVYVPPKALSVGFTVLPLLVQIPCPPPEYAITEPANVAVGLLAQTEIGLPASTTGLSTTVTSKLSVTGKQLPTPTVLTYTLKLFEDNCAAVG